MMVSHLPVHYTVSSFRITTTVVLGVLLLNEVVPGSELFPIDRTTTVGVKDKFRFSGATGMEINFLSWCFHSMASCGFKEKII